VPLTGGNHLIGKAYCWRRGSLAGWFPARTVA